MANDHDPGDASRIEAAAAGVHAEQREVDEHGSSDVHVDAVDAVHGSPSASHDAHDDDAGHGGHGADPNAGVLVGEPPTPAWVMTATAIAALTIAICIVLAIMLDNAADSGGAAEEEPAHGLAPVTLTIARV